MKTLRHLAPLLGAAALIAASACGATGSVPAVPGAASASPVAPAARPAANSVQKLLVFVVENHSLGEMRQQMPFVSSLSQRYGYASHYTAQSHPSLPNYLAMLGGSTFGVHDDAPPSAHPIRGRSVFGEAVAAGRTARVYADSMTAPCQTSPAGDYGVKHNAWAYFRGERAMCRQNDLPIGTLSPDVRLGRLPAIGLVVPNLCHDAHNCSLRTADSWLRNRIRGVMNGPDWRGGHLAIVITADEDDDHHGNRVLTTVADPALHHKVVTAPLSHYSLTRSFADVAGVAPLRHATKAPRLLRAFGLSAG